MKSNPLKTLGQDLPASVVVFLVALPLCIGVAVASGAPAVSGLIAGIAGGIVVGAISGSQLSVSGPAAGLTAIVAGALGHLPSFEFFLISVIICGVLQVVLGYLKAGIIGEFIPNAVIKGMLAAIGIILILKQLPHLVGFDKDPEGDESFFQIDGENTFSEIFLALNYLAPTAIIIGIASLIILAIYELKFFKKSKVFQLIPGPLIVVLVGVLINHLFDLQDHSKTLGGDHLVDIPISANPLQFFQSLYFPNWQGFVNLQVWISGLTLALVASLETLLSLEAVDKLDEQKRISPTNIELKAQGFGNIVSGFLGGLPVTSVIVRSSANVAAGAQSKWSAIYHGCLLLLSVLFIPSLLNLIPKAALAGILIFTGYKLAKISLFKEYWKKGLDQFLPFVITIVAILLTDLLIGICIGIISGLYFILRSNFRSAISVVKDDQKYLVRFKREVSFLNKAYLKQALAKIPDDSAVLIDPSRSDFIDRDVIEMIDDFIINAETRGIRIYIKPGKGENQAIFKDIQQRVMS
jgi:MFS superfamily sulfate permease-like transporter